MFICKICGNVYEDDEESIDENVCNECFDDEETTMLVALEII